MKYAGKITLSLIAAIIALTLTGCGKQVIIRTDNLTIEVDPNRINLVTDGLVIRSDQDTLEFRAGASSSSGTFYIHDEDGLGFIDIDDAYAIITDIDTGDMMHAINGIADATWGNCDIAFTQDVQNPYWAGCTIPALNMSKRYAITIYEDIGGDGTETNADPIRMDAMLFDPQTRMGYTDTNPIFMGRVKTE